MTDNTADATLDTPLLTDASGKIVKRVIFDRNIPEELKTLEVVLADGQKVNLDYLLPESHTSSFRTVVFDNV